MTLCGLATLGGCASKEHRTRYSDKNMRLMIDPASISVEDYVRIQTALVQQGMWTIVDRASGLDAIKREQESLHKENTDRYDARQRWAHWGKLYGVGAIIAANVQCYPKKSLWRFDANTQTNYCEQFINLIDASTGEVVLGVESGDYVDAGSASDWKEVAQKLADAYPKSFERVPTSERIETYKLESEENSRRARRGEEIK